MLDGEHTWWFLTRASGFVAYLLLFTSVVFGLTMTGGLAELRLRRFRLYDLHRFLSLLTVFVLVFHAFIVLPDGYIGFSFAELVVPFASPYRPAYMALGLVASYLTLAVVGSFYLRGLISYSGWRLLHYATFVAFAMTIAHSVGAGTDTGAVWARVIYASTGVVVFNLTVYRLLKGHARGIPAREWSVGASAPAHLEQGIR